MAKEAARLLGRPVETMQFREGFRAPKGNSTRTFNLAEAD